MDIPGVIPRPVDLVPLSGAFILNNATRIEAEGPVQAVAAYLQQTLRSTIGCLLQMSEPTGGEAPSGTIRLGLSEAGSLLGEEGYELRVTPASIALRAPAAAGLFYGVQTLRQLLPLQREGAPATAGSWPVPAVAIADQPRFDWRGLMLDVGRHFFPVDFVKRFIDLLALHKMNVFHWHLTEDQGWRLQVEKYPRLAEVGAWRSASPRPANRDELDGVPHGGFYTQAQVREVVQYAADRFVTVVPEVEMPGHATAALASYPELGCTGGPYAVRTRWGVEEDVYCAGEERVYAFLEDVLDEVVRLFPGRFVHIGGDECPKKRWQQCPRCQDRIRQAHLKDEDELQSYFIKRVEAILEVRGRRLIGWDEILEGGLAPRASVMSWRGLEGGIAAATAGHDVVMSPTSHCYFDYYQAEPHDQEPPAIGGFIPLEKVYAYEPVPAELPPDRAGHILGAQGNIWTEYMPDQAQVEYMAFPRACALAEVVWSAAHTRDFADFSRRLRPHLVRLRRLGVNCRDPFAGEAG